METETIGLIIGVCGDFILASIFIWSAIVCARKLNPRKPKEIFGTDVISGTIVRAPKVEGLFFR